MKYLRGSPSILVLLFYLFRLPSDAFALCPIQCKCDDVSLRANCKEADLGGIPITLNPELRELNLQNNHIKGIKDSFGVYHSLSYLDMSHNQLVSIGVDNFKAQKRLKVLLLSRNMVSSLQNETFFGLKSLQVLHLNINFLVTIEAGVFSPLDELQTLDLSSNRISSLSEQAFLGLKKLTTLLLRDNKLTEIPSSTLAQVNSLLKLDLGLNSFHEISVGAFESLEELEELLLDECAISLLHPESFQGLETLLILELRHNNLEQVPTEALASTFRVEELSIGGNLFVEINSGAFQKLKFLNKLDISGAKQLECVRKGAFSENSNLETVVFDNNVQLSVLETGVFDGLPNLRHVSLKSNALRYIDRKLLPWDELETLEVNGNPLVCNCSLFWLWTLLHSKNVSKTAIPVQDPTFSNENFTGRVSCVEPIELTGQFIVDLTPDDFECGLDDSKKQIIIGAVIVSLLVVITLALLAFRFRVKVAGVLKTKWNGNRKEPQYQKTNGEEENNILQAAQHPLKNTPVTEL